MQLKERFIKHIETLDFTKEFVVDLTGNKLYTYASFFEECYNLMNCINRYSQYDSMVVILDNSILLFKLYFAVALAGKKIYAIDPMKSEKEINDILSEIPEALLIKQDRICAVKKDMHKDLSLEVQAIDASNYGNLNIKNTIVKLWSEQDFEREYLITYTSGTTGLAKGVRNSFANLLGTGYAFCDKTKVAPGSKFLHVMPMAYMAGILNSIIYPFIAGLKIVLCKRFSVNIAIQFWNIVSKQEITVFWLSPTMVMMIDQVDKRDKGVDFCSNHDMKFFVGTAALTEKVRIHFEEHYGVKLYASYGLSETLFISVENSESHKHECGNNVGELLEGVEYKLDVDGELKISVPWMFLGYTNDDTEQYFEKEYYKTGDLATIENGILSITGRKKDLIIRGGINISPTKLEKVLLKAGNIKECAVYGVQGNYGEEMICCAYVLDEGSDNPTKAEYNFNQCVIQELGNNYRIDYFIGLEQLPRNLNGKIDKQKLEMEYRMKCDN